MGDVAAFLRNAGVAVAIASFGIVAPGGCVEIDGGAVEVSWAIFARDGRAITECSCADPRIAYVRLSLVSPTGDGQPCDGVNGCRFSCERKVGATPFMIPPGQYLMSVIPVDVDGNDLAVGPVAPAVDVPAAELRTVVRGQPTELEAFMLEANCAPGCDRGALSPCTGG